MKKDFHRIKISATYFILLPRLLRHEDPRLCLGLAATTQH
jgi:hypothetical protein